MHQRSLYFALSFVLSLLTFYITIYYRGQGPEFLQGDDEEGNLRHVQSNSSRHGHQKLAGQGVHQTLANVSRVTDNLHDVQNRTLGVQEVYMLTLPGRRDKRDAFAMQAAFSGIDYKLAEGVDGEMIPEKSLPHTMALDKKQLGCWRAHLNILESMVERRVESALIFEDDADWDVAFKQQLVQLARGSRFLLDTPNDTVPFSPYGDGWDILWIGHCAVKIDPEDNRRWVIPNDPTVVPPDSRLEFDRPDMSTWEDGPNGDKSTRVVQRSTWNICTAAYIISLKGAEKVIYHLSLLPFNDPIDLGMGFMCMFKKSNFTCISPFPTIVGVSRPPGDSSRWSDLDHGPEVAQVDARGHSERVSFSTRQNIGRLLMGEDKYVSEFPDVYPEMSLAEIGRGVGHAEWIELPPPEEPQVEEEMPVDEWPAVEEEMAVDEWPAMEEDR